MMIDAVVVGFFFFSFSNIQTGHDQEPLLN